MREQVVKVNISMLSACPMQRKLIAGNWKMFGRRSESEALLKSVAAFVSSSRYSAEVLVCPPFTLIPLAADFLHGTSIAIGGQDCSHKDEGAFTGDISSSMLKEAGCAYVILGHSERRQYHGETDQMVRSKAQSALEAGLIPIVCVGETLKERESGTAEKTVTAQLQAALPQGNGAVVAYEPVWAIGTVKTTSLQDIADMNACIHRIVVSGVGVLYGGSVKASNAEDILAIYGVDGALVGGASLKADEFCAIIAAAGSV